MSVPILKIAILYNKFFDPDGVRRSIGGVQTYLLNLAELCRDYGAEVTIFQWANRSFTREVAGIGVTGVPVNHLPLRKRAGACFSHVQSKINRNRDLLIFGADHISVPTDNPRHISIQHGVSWDLPVAYTTSRTIISSTPAALLKQKSILRQAKRYFENCANTVCVDYNFINWYRTTTSNGISGRYWVIPNFAVPAGENSVRSRDYGKEALSMIFARRFVAMRGTRIFAEAAKALLDRFPRLRITLAGEGPDESWLHSFFSGENRVDFITFLPGESLAVHLDHDIAVVPSIASEGTSFSAIEAMAAGCPVVASAVGGITNLIINRHNGILVFPEARSLRDGLETLITDPELRKKVGENGYETVRNALSPEHWQRSWKAVLSETAGE